MSLPQGDDTGNGSGASPFQTITQALAAVRPLANEAKEIILGDGVYYLTQALEISAEDSGTEEQPLVIRAANE